MGMDSSCKTRRIGEWGELAAAIEETVTVRSAVYIITNNIARVVDAKRKGPGTVTSPGRARARRRRGRCSSPGRASVGFLDRPGRREAAGFGHEAPRKVIAAETSIEICKMLSQALSQTRSLRIFDLAISG
jgi:hypothetical protein